jgi:hypothetical protein
VIAEIDVHGISPPPDGAQPLFDTLDRNLLDVVGRLVRLIQAPAGIPMLAGLTHREVIYRLLSGPSGHRLRQVARLGSSAALRRATSARRSRVAQAEKSAGDMTGGAATLSAECASVPGPVCLQPRTKALHRILHGGGRRVGVERAG